jgi:hypothetical protein
MNFMFQLKPISKEAIPLALQKAERYRLLNQPYLAESICQDILEIEPGNRKALLTRLLAITDQFGINTSHDALKARQLLSSLGEGYDYYYYSGIISERQGIAVLTMGPTGDPHAAYEWLIEAQAHFENAEKLRAEGNDDALLRWNTCARLIMEYRLHPRHAEEYAEPPLE